MVTIRFQEIQPVLLQEYLVYNAVLLTLKY